MHQTASTISEVVARLQDLKASKIFGFLTSKGVVLYEYWSKSLAEYFISEVSERVDNKKIKYIHRRLGWAKANDIQKGFLASKSIGAAFNSELEDNDDHWTGPAGSRAVYDDMIQNEVIPNKALHLPFVLAFTAPLVAPMYDLTACPVLITNFAGKSSQGKSTSLALMASVWGKGILSNAKRAIAKTFASTQNGFEATVHANNGIPVLFDDYESAMNVNFSSLIYTLAQGESKMRCDKHGTVKNTNQWRTFIGLTGESSIFDRAGNNLGLKPRIVEFRNVKWTSSKANAINITGTITKNYGFYGEEFVEKLIQSISKKELDYRYEINENIINCSIPPKDNISERIQTRLALIRMTAELVRELMDLDIDVEYITDVLVKNELERQESLDIFQMASESLISFVTKHYSSFVRVDRSTNLTITPTNSICGRIYDGPQGTVIAFLSDSFKAIMKDFNDKDSILEYWRDNGILITDTDGRFQKKTRVISSMFPSRCYVFVLSKLKELVSDVVSAEVVNLQKLNDQDLIDLRGRTVKQNIIRQYGEEYVKVPSEPNPEKRGKTYNPLHDFENPSYVEEDENDVQTPVCKMNVDDDESVDAIFRDGKGTNDEKN